MAKPRLSLHVGKATHFLEWELPYFKKYFELDATSSRNDILFVFGPDALYSGSLIPARKRIALLFPGFGYNPYHDLVHRYGMERVIRENYDLLFANPGPIAEAFATIPQLRLCPFSLNTDLIKYKGQRTLIRKLLHVSANYPQKDWTRSRDTMRLTGLEYEVYPPRKRTIVQKFLHRAKHHAFEAGVLKRPPLYTKGYENHETVIRKYWQYDGFVHIAGEIPPYVDGKYTATLLEAGLTGCILFWHDTLGLGNDFETIFSLPLDPQRAASEILNIRDSIDVNRHSRLTAEEIYERTNPDNVMRIRLDAMSELL